MKTKQPTQLTQAEMVQDAKKLCHNVPAHLFTTAEVQRLRDGFQAALNELEAVERRFPAEIVPHLTIVDVPFHGAAIHALRCALGYGA